MAEPNRGGSPGGSQGGLPAGATSRALVLPGVLALTAGFVDAVAFVHLFGVFPANQSGNLVLLGMAFTNPIPPPAWTSATAIVGFTAGTAGGAWLGGRRRPTHQKPMLLSVEAALLVGLAGANAVVDPSEGLLTGAPLGVLLVIASVAMGIQTEAIRQVAGVAVTTTYETGTMARIGESFGRRDRASAGRTASTVLVLGTLVACYVAGAAAGAGRLGDGPAGLVLPCLAVGTVLVAGVARRHVDD
jgi:uncharacterized membrane protein YoaK (UPF0700 family)